MFDALSTGTTPSGQRVTVEKALSLGPVWAAATIISEQIGLLPLKVYRRLDDGERVEARTHRTWRLLHDKPNDITPSGRFWSTMALHLLLWGNAFVEKRRDGFGIVDDLWLLPPAEVLVRWDPVARVKGYRHQPSDGRAARDLSNDDVLHVLGSSTDGIIGMSVIQTCRAAFGNALARDEFEGGFYQRGAVLSAVVETDNKLSPEAAANLASSVKAVYGGAGKGHGIGVFEQGVKFRTVGNPLRDLEFVASQNLSRTDIAVMFKLPPNYLGGSTGENLRYSTVEMDQIHFATHAIAPLTNTIAEALSQDPAILPQTVFEAEFVLDGMLRADSKTRAEVYTLALDPEKGWMTRSEVRRLENLSSDGDKPPTPPPDQLVLGVANGNGDSALPAQQEQPA